MRRLPMKGKPGENTKRGGGSLISYCRKRTLRVAPKNYIVNAATEPMVLCDDVTSVLTGGTVSPDRSSFLSAATSFRGQHTLLKKKKRPRRSRAYRPRPNVRTQTSGKKKHVTSQGHTRIRDKQKHDSRSCDVIFCA